MNGQKAKLIKRKARQYSNEIVKIFLDDTGGQKDKLQQLVYDALNLQNDFEDAFIELQQDDLYRKTMIAILDTRICLKEWLPKIEN
jgi:hypothetical protein